MYGSRAHACLLCADIFAGSRIIRAVKVSQQSIATRIFDSQM